MRQIGGACKKCDFCARKRLLKSILAKVSFCHAQLNYYILGVILSGAAAVPPRNRRISVQISTIFRRYLIEIPRQARDDKTRHLHFNIPRASKTTFFRRSGRLRPRFAPWGKTRMRTPLLLFPKISLCCDFREPF